MSNPIGLIDSGLGGFTIYYGLKKAYPDAPLVILADQKHSPYGPKSVKQLEAITSHNIELLMQEGCQKILFACNTISALLLDTMQRKYPNLQIKGVIDPTIKQIHNVSSLAVLATEANIHSGVYKKKLLEAMPNLHVLEIIPYHLVDYIEALADQATIKAYLKQVLASAVSVEALLLGCTHYPLVSESIVEIMDVPMYDSIAAMVDDCALWLQDVKGPSRVLTTHDPSKLQHQLKVLFNEEEVITKVG